MILSPVGLPQVNEARKGNHRHEHHHGKLGSKRKAEEKAGNCEIAPAGERNNIEARPKARQDESDKKTVENKEVRLLDMKNTDRE